jgi:hypothetical protein
VGFEDILYIPSWCSQFFFYVYEMYLHHILLLRMGWDNVMGIVTGYGLDGLGMESW